MFRLLGMQKQRPPGRQGGYLDDVAKRMPILRKRQANNAQGPHVCLVSHGG